MTESKNSRNIYLVGTIFGAAGILLSLLLICKHVFPQICSYSLGCTVTGGVDSCQELGQSRYSKILNVPIAFPGFFYYIFVTILMFRLYSSPSAADRKGKFAFLASLLVFGLVFDGALAFINFFVLVSPCMLCAYSYIALLGIVGSAVTAYFSEGFKLEGDDFMAGLNDSRKYIFWTTFAFALLLIVYFGSTGCRTTGGGNRQERPAELLPPNEVKPMLEDFRALKGVTLSTDGVKTFEGDPSAYIVIQDFADFRCPHCYEAGVILQKAMLRWPGRIKIYFRNFPLDGTCNPLVGRRQEGAYSCNGAQASICAASQGIFPKFYHSVFEFQMSNTMITLDNLQSLTTSLGGNWNQMISCMGSPATTAALGKDINDAKNLVIKSTPTIIIQNHMLPAGTPPELYILRLMDAFVYEQEGQTAYDEFAKRAR